jgi:hypothetical protein
MITHGLTLCFNVENSLFVGRVVVRVSVEIVIGVCGLVVDPLA